MLLTEARSYIGKVCSIQFQDRSGNERTVETKIFDATYVPLYGGYLITEVEDIRLDRISAIATSEIGALEPTADPIAA